MPSSSAITVFICTLDSVESAFSASLTVLGSSSVSYTHLLGRLQAGTNTTLGVVACNADLSTVECQRIAMMAQDGIARAVRPAHTPFDGDTVFALASAALPLGDASSRPAHVLSLIHI